MRKIEKDMLAAIQTRRPFNHGNTMVTVQALPKGCSEVAVFLHANKIATFMLTENGITVGLRITLAGWNTRTTRSRLDAVMRACNVGVNVYPKGLGVSSRKGVIRIHDKRGETVIDATGWFKVSVF